MLPVSKQKTKLIRVRFTPLEKKHLDIRAKLANTDLSKYVRKELLKK